MLRRDQSDPSEFLTLSLWENLDAIRAFAGDDTEAAVLYPEDARSLLGESTVTHYQVVDQAQDPPGQANNHSARPQQADYHQPSPTAHQDADPNLLLPRQQRTVHDVLARAVLAAQVS